MGVEVGMVVGAVVGMVVGVFVAVGRGAPTEKVAFEEVVCEHSCP